jgi:hypothetical protein
MKFLCMFFACRWIHHFDIRKIGVYQCRRCKTISVGAHSNDME